MTSFDPKIVSANERGLIRIYALDIPREHLAAFSEDNRPRGESNQLIGDDPWPLLDALDAKTLNSDYIEAFDVSDLAGVGLVSYLVDANGVAMADVEPYRELLDGVSGLLIVVFSAAFGGTAQTLSPCDPLRHIATFREENAPLTFEPLPDESAKSPVADVPVKKVPSDAAIGGRVATFALIVMGLLVWLMIWVAG